MAIHESGYGFTRTALNAKNLFGWKDFSTNGQAYVLTCQPADDPGNRYRIFSTFADSVLAVGKSLGRTAARPEYAKATTYYLSEVAANVAAPDATLHWLQAIQKAHYNPFASYPRDTIRFANNYLAPGDTISPEHNLYTSAASNRAPADDAANSPARRLAPVQPAQPQLLDASDPLLDETAKSISTRFQKGDLYVAGSVDPADISRAANCHLLSATDRQTPIVKPYSDAIAPDSAARLLECVNSPVPGAHVWAALLIDTPANLARRIVGACRTSAPDFAAACVAYFLDSKADYQLGPSTGFKLPHDWERRSTYEQNNFLFPIAGRISDECTDGSVAFQDGVTVQYPNDPSGTSTYCLRYDAGKTADWQKQVALTTAPWLSYCFGRLAAINRNDVPNFAAPSCTKGVPVDGFLKLVRDNEIKAVNTGIDDLMILKAARFRHAIVKQ